MSSVYILEDNTYTVSKCLTEDIEQHYSLVSEFISNINKTTYTYNIYPRWSLNQN